MFRFMMSMQGPSNLSKAFTSITWKENKRKKKKKEKQKVKHFVCAESSHINMPGVRKIPK